MNDYYADIIWEDGYPKSVKFGDVYFSTASGLEETRYVFHKHNNLEERFSSLKNNEIFVIGETGFGSGLNFLATLQLWRKIAPANTRLHFISIEKYPLHPDDLKKILASFPEVIKEQGELIAQYYLLLPGFHRLSFKGDVELTLIIGDISSTLPQLGSKIDAWFLDGFSPAKNSEMWTEEVFHQVARLSHANTTYATFTSSSMVRKALANAGFSVIKTKGFAFKREMIYGCHINSQITIESPQAKIWLKQQPLEYAEKEVAIIGGGISGAATAYSLAKRGYKVTIYEKNAQLAMEASGNYQGMLYSSWSASDIPAMELSYAGYRYSHYLIRGLLNENTDYAECGLIQLSQDDEDKKRQQQLLSARLPHDFFQYVNQPQIEELIGHKLNEALEGLYYPSGMWLKPAKLVNALVQHPLINIITGCEITDIKWMDNKWAIYNQEQQIATTPILVLANAYYVNRLEQTRNLPLRKIRGQISIVPQKQSIKSILCGKGYITPAIDGNYTLGATFNFNTDDLAIKDEEHQENLTNFSQLLSPLLDGISPQQLTGQVNFRSSPHDYLPAVGPITDFEMFASSYARIRQDRKAKFAAPCLKLPNLLLNIGHGAKGILTAPICGEIIADYIENAPMSCSDKLRQAIHPDRLYTRLLYT